MNENNYEKRIVYITKDNSISLSNDDFSISYDLLEVFKNVDYVKIIKSEIMIQLNGTNTMINDNIIKDGEPIFIDVNNYSRIITSSVGNDLLLKYFDVINVNLSERFGNNIPSGSIISFKNTSSTHAFNPCNSDFYVLNNENTVKKFYITLYDKYNNKIKKSDIQDFNLMICLYFSKKKVSQF